MEVALALSGLGLNDTEVVVYKAALNSGPRPASMIAKRAGLKRAHTYNILEDLKEKGVIQETIKNHVRHYCPLPPGSLLSMMENQVGELIHKKEKLAKVIPILEGLQSTISKQPKVRLFQGKAGIWEIFEDILRSGHDMYSIVDLQHSWSSIDEESRAWVKRFIERREAKGISWRAIAVKSEASDFEISWRSSAKRHVKMLEGVQIPAEVNIYGDKVALTSTSQEMVGAIIENQPIAETLLNIHGFLWGILPDYQ